jgi:hypothetical protein
MVVDMAAVVVAGAGAVTIAEIGAVIAEIAATAGIAGNRLASRRASQRRSVFFRKFAGSVIQFLQSCLCKAVRNSPAS